MTSELVAVSFDANDPTGLAHFWAAALRWDVGGGAQDMTELIPIDGTRFGVRFRRVSEKKVGRNRIHLDLTTASVDDQDGTVSEMIGLGAQHIDVGQTGDEPHVVLADPEGNELCIIGPDNNFLATCGRFGSITCDGSPAEAVSSRLHLEIAPVGSDDQRAEVDRFVGLGASRVELRDRDSGTVVMADPEGTEFRVLRSSS